MEFQKYFSPEFFPVRKPLHELMLKRKIILYMYNEHWQFNDCFGVDFAQNRRHFF